MLNKNSKNATRDKIHSRIRKKVAGTTARPRLNGLRASAARKAPRPPYARSQSWPWHVRLLLC